VAGAVKDASPGSSSEAIRSKAAFKSTQRVHKLVSGITQWQTTSSPGREVAAVPQPVTFLRPLAQYAVRTPSKEQASGDSHAVVFSSRTELGMTQVVEHSDGRAGMEADRKRR